MSEMHPKVIKTVDDYRWALEEAERLADQDPQRDSPAGERLELLATLLESYEKERFHFEFPDPIDAIRFRMEEQGLRQKDLTPYIGSKSKVSRDFIPTRPDPVATIDAL